MRTTPFILGALLVVLIIGMGLSYFASPNPDGLEASYLEAQCADAADTEACLEEGAGDAVYTGAPLPDYSIGWLSGLVGVAACFGLGAGLVWLARRGRGNGKGAAAP